MGQDVAHGPGVSDEGDDSNLAAAAWTDERKHLIDPREQQRPSVTGGATGDRFRFPRCFLCPPGRAAWRDAWRSAVGAIDSVASTAGVPFGTPASAVTCPRSGAFGASTP